MDHRECFGGRVWEQPEYDGANDARRVVGGEAVGRRDGDEDQPDDERKVTAEKSGHGSLAHEYGLQRGGSGNDFDDLVGDRGLADAVHVQRQAVDQLARVLRRGIHRGHACALFGRD